MQLFLDIEKAGDHELMLSMREDGFEMDKVVLSRNKEFKPAGKGPAVQVKSGVLPPPFPEVAEPISDLKPINEDAVKRVTGPSLTAKDFFEDAQGYYLDKEKWLAINPDKNKEGKARTWFPYPSGKYNITLHVVGESDGQSTFQVAIGETKVGDFIAPLGTQTFEEGPQFSKTWKDMTVRRESQIIVSSQIASADGKEWSRARVALVEFIPADDATRQAVANVTTTTQTSPKQVGPALAQPRQPDGKGDITVSGELKQWHKVTLTLDGPFAHEKDSQPNAFTDLAFNVTFTHQSGSPTLKVPGYFAADGDAANSSAEFGTKWRAHLSPDKAGKWNYAVSFTRGKHAALDGGGEALGPFDGAKGSFEVAPTDKTGRDFRAHGRLQYVGKRYLQFAGSQKYFFKAGPDSPETLLAYVDFDNTTGGKLDKAPLKEFKPHLSDWMVGDPTWRGGKGKGLIGALNYLASEGLNAFSFLTYNAAGDGDNVWPFIEREAKLNYDCSKLDQWGIVFDHATNRGLYLHFKLQENEMDDNRLGPNRKSILVAESLDGGILGPERKLYCRELIARFGHALALNWNIGEENTQSSDEIRDMARYLHDTDPYRHNIVVHTFPSQQDLVCKPLLGNKSLLTGVSLQNSWSNVHQRTLHWINESTAADRVWIVPNDEQNPASLGIPCDPGYKGHDGIALEKKPAGSATEGFVSSKPYTLHDIRKLTLWGNLMAGGAGVEYYFGYQLPENDLVLEDFRSRDRSWDYCRIAIEFLSANRLPLNEMVSSDSLIGNMQSDNSKYCLAKSGEIYVVYLPEGGTTELDLKDANGEFSVSWFNPRTGGALIASDVKQVRGGKAVLLGQPPKETDQDWVIIVRK
jgi:hypothetical protein